MFTLSPLPYDPRDLEPDIGARTLELHHDKHHGGYVEKLNKAIEGEDRYDGLDLLDIVKTAEGHVFNMAAQVWNHQFYWDSLSPKGGGEPSPSLGSALERDFGSIDEFKKKFRAEALGEFGSGWVWLLLRDDGSMDVASTTDADNPAVNGDVPLLTLDVWEHAYYLDFQNRRAEYVDAFFDHLINWSFAEANLEEALSRRDAER